MKVKRSRAGSASITALLLASGFGLTLVAAQRFLPDKALVTGGANPVATADATADAGVDAAADAPLILR